jgi:hypothetical protein
MALRGRREESHNRLFVDIDGGLDDIFGLERQAWVLLEVEVSAENASEDESHRLGRERRHPHHGELAEKAGGDFVSTTAGGSAGSDEFGVLDFLEEEFLGVVETALVDNLAEELARRLGLTSIKLGHVHVINEEDHLLAGLRSQHISSTRLELSFERVHQVLGSSFTGEVNKSGVDVLGGIHQVITSDNGFTNTSLSRDQHVEATVSQLLDHEVVLDGIRSRYENVEVTGGPIVFEVGFEFVPMLELVVLSVDGVLEEIAIG